jgi:hypothetical protein
MTQFVLTLAGAEILKQIDLVAITAGLWNAAFPPSTELTHATEEE